MATETKPIKSISKFVEPWKGKEGNLIMILHSMQNYYGYIPKEEAYKLSQELKIPLARIYEVLTFYNYFSLEPPAKYKVSVCMGTACYLQGAPELIKKFESELNVKQGKVTKDGLFKIEIVRCLGCCGLAPVVTINKKVYGKVKASEIPGILAEYKDKG